MKKLFVLFPLIILLLVSCAPAPVLIKDASPLEINFDQLEKYSVSDKLNSIEKPSPLIPIYVKVSGDKLVQVKTPNEATHILLTPYEYAKIGSLLTLVKSYKDVIKEQETLINTYIDQINSLKLLLQLEIQKREIREQQYVESENAYRLERYHHKMDNMYNKIQTISIGTALLLLIAL